VVTDASKPGSPNADEVTVRYTVLSRRAIIWWAVLITVIGIGMAVWLLLAYGRGDPQVQLDAIRTAGTIVVGTGGAAALLLAARRQRTAEIALKQKDRDQADAARAHALQVQVAEQTRRHQERVAAATEADAEARRITDLYTKAADQLGSDKAPVRLAGLYALERLAQDHVEQRQTIVNVLCAYLRMPYTLPGTPPGDNADDTVLAVYRERAQEREVRLAAQRILAHHLHPGNDPDHPVDTFWPDMDLDLSSATLIDLNLTGCRTHTATFTRAQFTGITSFDKARFAGNAWFSEAQFTDTALFVEVQFAGEAAFDKARFAGNAWFSEAQFTDTAWLGEAQFTGQTSFSKARFARDAWFHDAQFASIAVFDGVQFGYNVSFGRVQFTGKVPPEVVSFWSPPPAVAGQQQEGDGTRQTG
jgi:uncharacterized protein YjbI with pentapeptide repeats